MPAISFTVPFISLSPFDVCYPVLRKFRSLYRARIELALLIASETQRRAAGRDGKASAKPACRIFHLSIAGRPGCDDKLATMKDKNATIAAAPSRLAKAVI
jgi:hypothetical protein